MDAVEVIGHLLHLWTWALVVAPHGDLCQFSDHDIAAGFGWTGPPRDLIEALMQCGGEGQTGFLEKDYTLRHWHRHTWKARLRMGRLRHGRRREGLECGGVVDGMG